MKIWFILLLLPSCLFADTTEINAYWKEVSRSVREGDFEAYKATCHPEGVLVAGTRQKSEPLSEALARWKKNFTQTKSGEMKANASFRFSQRIINETTAHETGILLYTEKTKDRNIVDYVHLETLLVKKNGRWLILMEYQKSAATEAEWKALAPK